jgi:hypothetical protein
LPETRGVNIQWRNQHETLFPPAEQAFHNTYPQELTAEVPFNNQRQSAGGEQRIW